MIRMYIYDEVYNIKCDVWEIDSMLVTRGLMIFFFMENVLFVFF